MSDEISTPNTGGGEALPAITQDPKADAAAMTAPVAETPSAPEPADEAKAAADKAEADRQEEKKRNRTRDYINKINREAAELRQKLAQYEASQNAAPTQVSRTAQPAAGEPTPEQFDYDPIAFARAHSQWAVDNALTQREQQQKQQAEQDKQQETWTTYEQRVADFADDHPDFLEVVGSIPYPLSPELQAAIAAHENGPALAYHLGTNDDEAFALASIQPHLAAAAVERLASRLSAAPQQPQVTAAALAPTPKPITKAPPPAPQVGGRSPVEVPAEKLTDEEWFKREQARAKRR